MNQQLIKQIEKEIQTTQNNIKHWKEVIQQHENTLSDLIEELSKIKENMNKNNQKSQVSSNNNNK